MTRAPLERLRAEIQSDLVAFEGRVRELETTRPAASDAGACALTAVALHHAYGSIESARVDRSLAGVAAGLDA